MFNFKNFVSAALAVFCLFEGALSGKQASTPDFSERYTYEHVIIIGVDGAGNFHKDCDTPNMDKLFIKNGAWTDNCRVTTPSISAQCWGSMLTGVKPYYHKLTNDNISKDRYAKKDYPTVFRLLRNAHPDAEIGSFVNWSPINYGLVETTAKVTLDNDYDDVLTEKICKYIKSKKPELLFIQFDSVDHAGHSYGYGTEDYLKSIETIDEYVGDIYNAIKSAGIADSTLLIITADHGGIGTSHGGTTEEEMNTFFGVNGTSVNKTGDISVLGRDLAAIVCYALGIEGNQENWDSFIPENLFLDNMKPEQRPEVELPEATGKKTPAIGTAAGIDKYIDMEHLVTGLFFDNGLADIKEGTEVKTEGTVYYPSGYYGSAIRVSGEGYLSFPALEVGDGSYTVSFWVKMDEGQEGARVFFSNKDYENENNYGYAYVYNSASKFNFAKEGARFDFDYSDPEDFTVWNHITVSVDKDERKVRIFTNFEMTAEDTFRKTFQNSTFDTGMPLNFGQDGTGKFAESMTAEFDDILIFDKALTAEEVAALGNYYIK